MSINKDFKRLERKYSRANIQLKSLFEAKSATLIAEQQLKVKTDYYTYHQKDELKLKLINEEFKINIKDLHLDIKKRMNQSLRERIKTHQKKLKSKDSEYELFKSLDIKLLPENRLPNTGIKVIPLKYHRQNVERIENENENFGDDIHPILENLIHKKYPLFKTAIHNYCRPHSTTNAVFNDFNRAQFYTEPSQQQRKDDVLELIFHFLKPTPYRPIHYDDTIYAKLPLNTGTGYYNKRSYAAKSHAKFSHPFLYRDYPTTKGYFINYTFLSNKSTVHQIKDHGVPLDLTGVNINEKLWKEIGRKLYTFVCQRPTNMYVRLHISKRNGEKKVRPVYGVDDLFLTIEVMLTLPLLVQARQLNCSIMHSYETLRGANQQLDREAMNYRSFATLDYSRYDQSVPFAVSDTYFTDFLPRLIIVNKEYQPTVEYPYYTHQPNVDSKFKRFRNLLLFYHFWFRNMVYLSADGYAYSRQYAGIPSGMLNTQQLDSYCNLYLICDSLLEYGLSKDQIKQLKIFVLGDDNTIFTHQHIYELEHMVEYITRYLRERWNMTISIQKCKITDNRQYIETLSYQCNFGEPKKDIEKLCAHLFYPEHGLKPKFMSSRAVGMAYAACAIDEDFHSLCEDVYNLFLPYAEKFEDHTTFTASKYLPGVFQTLEDNKRFLTIDTFPTIETVREQTHKWKGELSFDSKWASAHFINPPNHHEEDDMTMWDYAIANDHTFELPPLLM